MSTFNRLNNFLRALSLNKIAPAWSRATFGAPFLQHLYTTTHYSLHTTHFPCNFISGYLFIPYIDPTLSISDTKKVGSKSFGATC